MVGQGAAITDSRAACWTATLSPLTMDSSTARHAAGEREVSADAISRAKNYRVATHQLACVDDPELAVSAYAGAQRLWTQGTSHDGIPKCSERRCSLPGPVAGAQVERRHASQAAKPDGRATVSTDGSSSG